MLNLLTQDTREPFAARTAVIDGDSLSSSQIWSSSSTNLERRATGYWTHAAAQLFQIFSLRYAQGYGNGGDKIANILSGQSTVISYIEANNIDAVFLHLGTNDVEDTSRTIAALKADYSTLISNYVDASNAPYVFVGLPFPRGDWEGASEGTRANYVQRLHDIRGDIKELVKETLVNPRLILWDAWDDIVDTSVTNSTNGLTYFPKTGYMNNDGVHLLSPAAHWAGKRCAESVKQTPLWNSPTALPDNTGLINTATYGLTGTGGSKDTGVSGDVADGCRVDVAAGSPTAVCSKETINIFGITTECQKIVISGDSVDNEEIYFYLDYPEKTGASYSFDGTKGIECVIPIKITDIVQMNGIYMYCRVQISSNYITKDMAVVSADTCSTDDAPYEWLLRTEPLITPSGNPTRQQMILRMEVDGSVENAGATIYIGKPFYRQSA